MIGAKLGPYEITAKLGEGGMGEVYRARDTKLERDVAIKVLPPAVADDPERIDRFRREAKALAALDHPGIVTVFSVEEADGVHFLAMQLVEGEPLDRLIPPAGLPLDRLLAIVAGLAEALATAHERGIVHRDLKPANVMLTSSGQVKILDFGLAKMNQAAAGETIDPNLPTVAVTREGTILGTAPYMSPEQVQGRAADPRSDLFSLGVMIYEMATGRRPFRAESAVELMSAILRDSPEAVTARRGDLPPAFDRIVRRAMAKDPTRRYQSARDLLAEWLDLRDELAASRARASSGPPAVEAHAVPPARTSAGSTAGGTLRAPALAVLPFTGLKPDADTDFLGFALADQVIGALAYVRSLRVKPSSAIRRYQDRTVDPAAAAHELEVDYLLTGSYLKEAGTVRLNVELVRAEADEMLWRDALEVPYESAFRLQDMVAELVVRGLEVRFPETERRRIGANVPADPAAYERYLRSLACPHTNEGDARAIALLRRALELDAEYAPAQAQLGLRLRTHGTLALLGPEAYREAESRLLRALALDPDHLPALSGLAVLAVDIGKTEEALDHVRRLLEVNPNHALGHFALSYLLRYAGLIEEAKRAAERALALDPGNPELRSLGFLYVHEGEYEKAIRIFAVDAESVLAKTWIGYVKYLSGDEEAGIVRMREGIAHEPEGHLGYHFGALLAAWRGERERGRELLARWEESEPYDAEIWYQIANTAALLGDRERCVRTLRRAIEGGFFCYPYMLEDPLLAGMREDREVGALLERARARHEAFAALFRRTILPLSGA